MKAGRELDALVAEHVMGWEVRETKLAWTGSAPKDLEAFDGRRIRHVPRFSVDIRAAWEVVEKMGGCWRLKNTADVFDFRWWNGDEDGWERQGFDAWAQADTVPHVICLAALKAYGVEVGDE